MSVVCFRMARRGRLAAVALLLVRHYCALITATSLLPNLFRLISLKQKYGSMRVSDSLPTVLHHPIRFQMQRAILLPCSACQGLVRVSLCWSRLHMLATSAQPLRERHRRCLSSVNSGRMYRIQILNRISSCTVDAIMQAACFLAQQSPAYAADTLFGGEGAVVVGDDPDLVEHLNEQLFGAAVDTQDEDVLDTQDLPHLDTGGAGPN